MNKLLNFLLLLVTIPASAIAADITENGWRYTAVFPSGETETFDSPPVDLTFPKPGQKVEYFRPGEFREGTPMSTTADPHIIIFFHQYEVSEEVEMARRDEQIARGRAIESASALARAQSAADPTNKLVREMRMQGALNRSQSLHNSQYGSRGSYGNPINARIVP